MCGKGDTQRPRQIGRAEYDLRWALAFGKITFKQFEQKMKELKKKARN